MSSKQRSNICNEIRQAPNTTFLINWLVILFIIINNLNNLGNFQCNKADIVFPFHLIIKNISCVLYRFFCSIVSSVNFKCTSMIPYCCSDAVYSLCLLSQMLLLQHLKLVCFHEAFFLGFLAQHSWTTLYHLYYWKHTLS